MKNIWIFRLKYNTLLLPLLLLFSGSVLATDGAALSYHGQMGEGYGDGMLEKWCALPNFSFEQQGGIAGWTLQSCNNCHIGSDWNPKGAKTDSKCDFCHFSEYPTKKRGELPDNEIPTIAKCTGICHAKDVAKRGDQFTPEEDVHIARGMDCQDCHQRRSFRSSDHQFLKGTAIDTSEPTLEGTLSCLSCHRPRPHYGKGKKGENTLNDHTDKVACETCHTGLRPAAALASRNWTVFVDGKPLTTKRAAGWLPEHKWYDNTGAGAPGGYLLPILGYTERRDYPGAKIYPFNSVNVEWFVKTPESGYEDVIVVSDVKGADYDSNGTTTVPEMQKYSTYPEATLVTADMNFSISHSVVPSRLAFDCTDCHGRNGWVLDWQQLGYETDPKGKKGGKKSK